jgi:hypothetical protein
VPDKKMINVRLNPQLWARAKAAASERGTTLERWVTEALESHISSQQRGEAGAGAGPSVLETELAWRVSALEQAIDYLAQQIGAGLPGGGASAGGTPAPGR